MTSPLARMTVTEFKLYLRDGVAPTFGIVFPTVLLVILGSIPYFKQPQTDAAFQGLSLIETFVPILATFVVAMFALNLLPPVLTGYREKGILRRLRTTPAGAGRVLTAQLVVGVCVIAVAVAILLVAARLGYSVAFPKQVGGFLLALALTAAALMALGLLVAAAAPSGRAANAIGAIIFYPMTFFSGLWYPVQAMPTWLQHVSHVTPLGAADEAIQDASIGHFPAALPLVTLAAYAVVCALGAARLFRWE